MPAGQIEKKVYGVTSEGSPIGNKVLIVDDQQGIRLLLSEVLHKEGYFPLQASNAAQAQALIERECLRLVLLDVRIPGIDGIELLKITKQTHRDLEMIVMTGYDDQALVRNALSSGAAACFSKPFDIQELMAVVKRLAPLAKESQRE